MTEGPPRLEEGVPIAGFSGHHDSFRIHKERSARTVATDDDTSDSKDDVLHLGAKKRAKSEPSRFYQHVKFGEVHERQFRMTMGRNPEAKGAVPLELSWDKQSSVRFQVDAYEEERAGSREVHKIAKNRREQIALLHHTQKSIANVIESCRNIRLSRAAGKLDNVAKEEHKEEKRKKRQNSIFGRLFQRKK